MEIIWSKEEEGKGWSAWPSSLHHQQTAPVHHNHHTSSYSVHCPLLTPTFLQDLKDMMRDINLDVTFADAHKTRANHGYSTPPHHAVPYYVIDTIPESSASVAIPT